MFPLLLDLQFFIDFKAFWKGLGRVWEGFGEVLGEFGEGLGRVWAGAIGQKAFGNSCLKFGVNVPQCLGRCSLATGQNEVGPADRAQRLNIQTANGAFQTADFLK